MDDTEENTQALFVEAEEVLRLIRSFSDGGAEHETAAERIASTLDRYQEQPGVLDPQLEEMVTLLLGAVRDVAHHRMGRSVLPHACRVMYALCKVRGYKTIVKFVPHDVADLEPLVTLLSSYDPTDHDCWQVAYSLMVWLSIVVMVPEWSLSTPEKATAHASARLSELTSGPTRLPARLPNLP